MAGKRHHHFWQLFQRGFGIEEHGDYQIWVHQKDQESSRTVTRNFGQEKYFYGPAGSLADENITVFENKNQSMIQTATNAEDRAKISAEVIAPIIAHLEMRSLFMREEISRVGERAFATIGDYFRKPKARNMILRNAFAKDPQMFNKTLLDGGIPAHKLRSARRYIKRNFDQLLKEIPSNTVASILTVLQQLAEKATTHAKDSHVRSLEANFNEVERTKSHLLHEYRVKVFSSPLILPDTTLAFSKNGIFSPISMKGDIVSGVILPISHNRAIIGESNLVRRRTRKKF